MAPTNFNCETPNLIYVIIYSACNKEYIGQSGGQLQEALIYKSIYRQLIPQPEYEKIEVERHLRTCAKGIFKFFPFFKMKEWQFGYYPLIWVFHSRGVNNKINHLHEGSLRIVYKDNISSFEDLLKKDRSFTIHQRNIQSLAIELFKVKGNLSNNIMCDIFQTRKINYHLRSQTDFASICVNTHIFGLNSLRYLGSQVRSMLPLEIKNSESVEIFKKNFKIRSLRIFTATYVRPM